MGKAELKALQQDGVQAGSVQEARGTIHLLSPIRNPPQLRPALGTHQASLSLLMHTFVSPHAVGLSTQVKIGTPFHCIKSHSLSGMSTCGLHQHGEPCLALDFD